MTHAGTTREAFELVGLETRASNDDPRPIGELWQRFFADERVRGIDALDDVVVAVYCDYEGDHTQPYTFFLGRRTAPGAVAPEGLARREVPAGTFARFVAVGEQPAALIKTWQEIWEAGLTRRYDADYELHSAGDPSRVEIFVGT